MSPAGWGDAMSTGAVVRPASGAASRIADTLLRVVGGREVQLRVPTQPSPGDGGQLGQPSPAFEDYSLAPVVFRRLLPTMTKGEPNRYELLISSNAVTNLVATLAVSSAEAMFQTAVGVVVDSNVMPIVAIGASEAFGAAYLYTLTLRDQ
jgi:hypothetical protein